MKRLTRRIGNGTSVEFVDGEGYSQLSTEESMKLLLNTLADYEDELEDKKQTVMLGLMEKESQLYLSSKDTNIKAIEYWGALSLACQVSAIDWDAQRRLFGEFMSKVLELRK